MHPQHNINVINFSKLVLLCLTVNSVLVLHNYNTGSSTGCFKLEFNQGLMKHHGDACAKQRANSTNTGASVSHAMLAWWRQTWNGPPMRGGRHNYLRSK
jgi:hypothetical protein